MTDSSQPLLEAKGLHKHFAMTGALGFGGEGVVKAVNGIDLQLWPGETLGVVGESGCGKTTLARLLLLLEKPTEGQIFFKGDQVRIHQKDGLGSTAAMCRWSFRIRFRPFRLV